MNQENITRTFSTGQSDITRHDAYTKAQGLNWANANTPKYVAADKFNGYEYVDLGLPSGTLWAKMNVGAEDELDAGLYFAWGETTGYTEETIGPNTKVFLELDYKWYDIDGDKYTKYNSTDNKQTLDLEDDAARVNMGGKWHMPNSALIVELLRDTINGFIYTGETVYFLACHYNSSNKECKPVSNASIDILDSKFVLPGYIFFNNTVSVTSFEQTSENIKDAISNGDYLFIPIVGVIDSGINSTSGLLSNILSSDGSGANSVSSCKSLTVSAEDADYLNHSASFAYDLRYIGSSVRGVIGELESQGGGEGESDR